MKNDPLDGRAGRGADEQAVLAVDAGTCDFPFTISDFQAVEYGSKRATFIVHFRGLHVETDLFIPDGRPPFAVPTSVREKFSAAWKRTVRFDNDLAEAILREALPRLTTQGEKTPMPGGPPIEQPAAPKKRNRSASAKGAFFDKSEQRFERASEDFGT